MNEVKAEVEGVIRAIHVGNAEPVEYGQLLFELEPVNGRPLDARLADVHAASSSRTGARSPSG